MRLEDLKEGDTLRTVYGDLRLVVRVEKHNETNLDVWLTWLFLESGAVKRCSYSREEPISPNCLLIRKWEELTL